MERGLYLPEGGVKALERRSKDGNPSTVLAVGPGGWREGLVTDRVTKRQKKKLFFRPTTLKPGDRVLLGFHPGVAVSWEGETLHFIRESEIQSLITGE